MGSFDALVVIVQLVAAAGIAGFWLTLGRSRFDEPWRPPGFAEHERAFPLPDLVAAALLTLSAVLESSHPGHGRSLALVAAGMLIFLGLIDFNYMRQNDLFARAHDGRMHAVIVGVILLVAALILLRHL
ncbi:MAG: hypothetical protein IT293_17905 [Deltaproteobacteria bacterium]|nr:hypothetical protein [Deltaproteobacteria bacterium]